MLPNAHFMCTENAAKQRLLLSSHPTLSTLHYTLPPITPSRVLLLETKVRSEGCWVSVSDSMTRGSPWFLRVLSSRASVPHTPVPETHWPNFFENVLSPCSKLSLLFSSYPGSHEGVEMALGRVSYRGSCTMNETGGADFLGTV